MSSFSIGPDDLKLFEAASHDRNPLHVSEDYARRTAYGKPVVFGILTALKAMRFLPERENATLASVTLSFAEPVFEGVNQAVRHEEVRGRSRLIVEDAGRKLLTASLEFRPATGAADSRPVRSGDPPRPSALKQDFEGLSLHQVVEGRYAPAEGPFTALLDRLGLAGKGVQAPEIAALLWASYLVGMELPGERALFARLKVSFEPDHEEGPIDYQAAVEGLDGRFDLVEIRARLSRGVSPFATVEIGAYVRRDTPRLSREAVAAVLSPSEALRGKVALVVGGSRGLGAALVVGLVQQGATVLLHYRSSHDEARALADSLAGETGRVELVAGDATDNTRWSEIRAEVIERFGGLDLLICNAAPPLRSMGFDLDALDRFRVYVSDQLAMAGAPLVAFAKSLNDRAGSIVLVSSIAVTQPPPEWHHYVVAKVAAEAMAREIATKFTKLRLLIARPPRLLTDMTNTPGLRGASVPVERVAGRIVGKLVASTGEPRVSIDEFPGEVAS